MQGMSDREKARPRTKSIRRIRMNVDMHHQSLRFQEDRMGIFSFKKKVVKEVSGGVWGELVGRYKFDVDTLANQIRCVEREGVIDGGKKVTFLRIFRLSDIEKRGIEGIGWETFDQHPDLLLFEGYLTRNNEAYLEPKKNPA
jgi:hypothetical protein